MENNPWRTEDLGFCNRDVPFHVVIVYPPSFSVTFTQGVHTLGRDGQGLVQGESVPKR